jgi:hypothetical protein
VTARRLLAISLLLLPAGTQAETVNLEGFTFEVQASGALYRGVRVGGDVESRYDIAVLGDGFTLGDQSVFNAAVNEILAEFFTIPPYDTRRCAFNFWVVNLVSDDSGIDEGTTQRDTPLDCKRAVPGEPISYVTGDFDKCRQVCDLAEVPARDAIYVMVNSTGYSSYAYPSNAIAFTSRRSGAGWFVAHELAHLIAELDDEYRCRVCTGGDDDRIYFGPEPESPNLTTVLNPLEVKWKDLLAYPDDPVPTEPEFACQCRDVGFWVGGGYHAYGIYRPEEYCLMDGTLCIENDAFCKVCVRAIKGELLWCPSFTVDTLGAVPVAQLHDMRDMERIIWQDDTGIARRIKYCSLCEPEDPHLTMIVIEIPDPRAGTLAIIDDLRNTVATGEVADGELRATFVMNPARTYYAIIDPGPPTADILTFRARMSIDGRAVDLRP